jgi:hypothetical protein
MTHYRLLTTNNHTLPSHLRLCSLFVASYDSQGLRWKYSNPPPHGVKQPGGPCPHIYTLQEQGGPAIPPETGLQLSQSQSRGYVSTDGQSPSLSFCQAPICGSWLNSYYWQFRVCRCGASFLLRVRVCSLQLLLGLASTVILVPESLGTYDYILLSQILDRFPYLYPSGKLPGLRLSQSQSQSQSYITTDSQSVLVSRLIWDFWPEIFFLFFFF